jgi:imidazolonepropionase-like amidohydrolase
MTLDHVRLHTPMPRLRTIVAVSSVLVLALMGDGLPMQAESLVPRSDTAQHARRPARLLIRQAMVIYGNGRPPYGPVDILVQDGLIANIAPTLPVEADAVIEAAGKYVMPGMVNTHMHWHDERAGLPMPIQYARNLYLAAGVTLTRENGGNFSKSKQWQAESAANTIVAPRMQVYWVVSRGSGHPDALRANVREAKARGADGLKIFGMDRDQLEAVMHEAKAQGFTTTTHIAVEETTAKDFIELGVDSIEHFYGVADAALDGVQNFPADMNYSDELMRFSRAGELYAQANPARLDKVLDDMVAAGVSWSPTLSIYEASRDLIKAQNLPWYRDYLHPALQAFFEPNLAHHGSYFTRWTNTMEVRWRQQYRIWMDALRAFGTKGGRITTGDDAGFIYSLYGFGLIRELELQEEAGFHPLEVIRHATVNGATLLGMGERLGRVRQGYLADLLVVNGNPIENLRVLNPYGIEEVRDGALRRGGGIEWTIKDGIPYHVPTLMHEVRGLVDEARRRAPRTTSP